MGGLRMTRIVRETGDDGIRPYGPGKFHTLIDSFAFEVAGDGVDEEASYGEGGGWYGLVLLDAPTRKRVVEVAAENRDALTEDEQDLLDDSVAIIFFERSDGIVEADWFEDEKKAEKAWEEIEADTAEEEENEEDDFDLEGEMETGVVIRDARGGKFSVSLEGKSLGLFSDFDDALLAGLQKANDQNYFPNVFHVNDHGNVDLLSVTPEVVKNEVVSVEYTVERSWT
jgi:hypothetical protein